MKSMELFVFKCLCCFSYFPLWNLRSEQLLIDKGIIKIYNIIYIFMKFEGKKYIIIEMKHGKHRKYSQSSLL